MRALGWSASSPCSGWPNSGSHNGTRRGCARRAASNSAPRIIHLMVALHAFWLLGLWMFGNARAVDPSWFAAFVAAAGGPGLGDREPRPALDHAGDRVAGGGARCARALSLAPPSELFDRRCRDRGGSAGARPAAFGARYFRSPMRRLSPTASASKTMALAWAGRAAPAPSTLNPATLANESPRR